MRFEVDWRPGAIEDVRELFEYLATNASLWDAQHVTDRVLAVVGQRQQARKIR